VTSVADRRRRWAFPAAVAVLLALSAPGLALVACDGGGGHDAAWIAAPGGAAAGGQAGGGAADGALPTANPTGATGTAPPERVRIPDIGVDAPLELLQLLADGSLDAPKAWADGGWYADGTRPGDVGPAVIAGHVDSRSGPAVFYKLDKVRVGAVVEVLEGGRWLPFRVTSVGRYPKNAFPTAQVYGPTPDAQLRLITCGGEFDRAHSSYLDNTVVYAVAA
jgi:Sortase domain